MNWSILNYNISECRSPTVNVFYRRTYASLGFSELTHLPLDKMAAVLADDIFKCIFVNGNDRIPIQISLTFDPDGPIDNN